MKYFLQTLVLTLLAFSTTGNAHDHQQGTLHIDHPYVRATPPGAMVAGGFMAITNNGSDADRLIGGSVDFAESVEIHEMFMQKDVMVMQQVAGGLEIPANGKVTLKPGGYHVMFINLNQGLKPGEQHRGILQFEQAGKVEVIFNVETVKTNQQQNMNHHEGHH